jgi:hypothetical protein
MSTITVSAPRTRNWVGSQIALALLIVVGVAMLAFSVGRVTATDHNAAPIPHVTSYSGTKWGSDMCAHGIPCR